MLRPIDTQTIYQQTPEVSNRQQALKQGEEMQQTQFAQMFHKETKEKQSVVIETKENAKADNDLNKKRGRRSFDDSKKYKKKKQDKRKEASSTSHIDLRI